MLDNHPGYQFLKCMHPHDRITWWVGAVAREAAGLELTLGLIYRELSGVAGKRVDPGKNDWSLGTAIANIRERARRLGSQNDPPSFADRLIQFLDSMEGVADRRNRIIHDPIARGDGQWVAFGSGHVFTDREASPISESALVEFHALLESLRREAEGFWSEAAQLER